MPTDRARVSAPPPPLRGNNSRPQWEYRHTTADLDADLTQFGQDGWELVSVVPIPHDPTQAIYHFKRRRAS
jgi:hypothetical protein